MAAIAVLIVGKSWQDSDPDRSNYAVIIPLSLDELRKQERGRNKWQNVSGAVGIISLIVAVTVAVVNRLIPMP